jgi:NhaD family Na+/H+ antiporter
MVIIVVFILGYLAIAFEHPLKINKAAIALVTGALCWTIYVLGHADKDIVSEDLMHQLGETAGILFFLLGAMTIVELVDAHDGFEVLTGRIRTTSARRLLWVIALFAFFLSAVLDNLTTSIVMVSLLRKLIDDKQQRMMFAGIVIIAANAGGAWSPIGDVTTTMLWIGGQITAVNIIIKLIIPSLVSLLIPLIIASFLVKGKVQRPEAIVPSTGLPPATKVQRNLVFFAGLAALLFVPVFKTITHLPPFMGMLLGLGILWIITELVHSEKDEADRHSLSVGYALRKIDTSSILFFLGILVAIGALQSAGHLAHLSNLMNEKIGNQSVIVLLTGALSAIVDNVPLVAATMGMYDLNAYPPDSYIWEFLAYAAGTGGSMLIIGSAAGVAVMGMEKIDFIWYAKKIGWIAGLGYIAGALTYMGLEYFFHL